MSQLKNILIQRDGYTEEEADKQIEACRQDLMERLENGETPDDILEEWFGLEPDYLFDIM